MNQDSKECFILGLCIAKAFTYDGTCAGNAVWTSTTISQA
jgi:hypothetical protein